MKLRTLLLGTTIGFTGALGNLSLFAQEPSNLPIVQQLPPADILKIPDSEPPPIDSARILPNIPTVPVPSSKAAVSTSVNPEVLKQATDDYLRKLPPAETAKTPATVLPIVDVGKTPSSIPTVPVPPVGTSASTTVDPAIIKQAMDDYLRNLKNSQPTTAEQIILNPGQPTQTALPEAAPTPTLQATWENQTTFTSPDKDFRIHIGGRFQYESIYFIQPQKLKGPPAGNGGIPASAAGGGVAPLDDGSFFRRVRLRADGTAYKNVEFVSEIDFEQLNLITFDHMWVGLKDIPYLGTIRVGQHKIPQGLEMMASDYHLTFLQDRSSLSESFWTLFGQGVFWADNYLDKSVSAQAMFHRIQPTGFATSDFGDANYAGTGRVTWTPYYEEDGRYLVHVGSSYQYRTADLGRTIQPGGTGNAFGDSQSVVRFRSRPELRDATGVGSVGSGILGGNPSRYVDTGYLLANSVQTFSPEFLVNYGPFAVQAEAAFSKVQEARALYPAKDLGKSRLNPLFWGGYIETSYFLTGENRSYDRRFGTFDRAKLRKSLRFSKCDDGCEETSLGAWQIAYRYSFLDLDDSGVNGGLLTQQSVGLNWYLTDNLKVQFMYNNAMREVSFPARSGTTHGFGTLVQWYF